jgi:starvation-inducible DNA-binding protein
MLRELCADNRTLTALMREVHELCDLYGDVATASLLENWIDDSEGVRGSLLRYSSRLSNDERDGAKPGTNYCER